MHGSTGAGDAMPKAKDSSHDVRYCRLAVMAGLSAVAGGYHLGKRKTQKAGRSRERALMHGIQMRTRALNGRMESLVASKSKLSLPSKSNMPAITTNLRLVFARKSLMRARERGSWRN